MSEFDKLIGRLEEAGEGSAMLDLRIFRAIMPEDKWFRHNGCVDAPPNYTQSFDAALTLVPDGCRIYIEQSLDGGWFDASVYRFGDADEMLGDTSIGVKTPASALCIAALKAREALK